MSFDVIVSVAVKINLLDIFPLILKSSDYSFLTNFLSLLKE